MSEEVNYEQEIRQQITKRYENRREFFGNLAAFIVFNIVVWTVLNPQEGWHTIAILITGGWSLGLVVQFINFIMTEARENAIAKAIERERRWRGEYAPPEAEMKRKRARLSDLSDDGELIEIVEDDGEEARYKRR